MTPRPVLVVGLGHPDRGDDGVGPVVVRAAARRLGPDVEVLEHEDPTDLALLWAGRERAVVVDAVRTPAGAPGRVHVLRTGAGSAPLGADDRARTAAGGTHVFGLAAAVELSRALGTLPAEVTVVGVEAADVGPGAPLSPQVATAVPAAVAAVLDAVGPRPRVPSG